MSCMHEILCNRIEDIANTCMVAQASISHAINRSNHTILPTRWSLYLNTHGFLFRNSVERNLIDSGVCVKNRLMHTHTHKFNWICIHHENSCHVKLDTWNVCSIWFIWLLWHARKYISERFQSNCDAVDCRSESDRFVKQFYYASCTNSMVANFSFNKFTGSMGCACVLDGLQKSFQCQTKKTRVSSYNDVCLFYKTLSCACSTSIRKQDKPTSQPAAMT